MGICECCGRTEDASGRCEHCERAECEGRAFASRAGMDMPPLSSSVLERFVSLAGITRIPGETDIQLRARLIDVWRGSLDDHSSGFCDGDFDERYGS